MKLNQPGRETDQLPLYSAKYIPSDGVLSAGTNLMSSYTECYTGCPTTYKTWHFFNLLAPEFYI